MRVSSMPKDEAELKMPTKLLCTTGRYRSVLACSGVGPLGFTSSSSSFLLQLPSMTTANAAMKILFSVMFFCVYVV